MIVVLIVVSLLWMFVGMVFVLLFDFFIWKWFSFVEIIFSNFVFSVIIWGSLIVFGVKVVVLEIVFGIVCIFLIDDGWVKCGFYFMVFIVVLCVLED